jgi:hypothetical protein
MPLPSNIVHDQIDQGTDDPRLARTQIDTLASEFNDLLTFLALSTITSTPLTVGDGLEGAAGALRAKLEGATLLRSAAGLKVNAGGGANQIPILDANGKFTTGVFLATVDAQQQLVFSGAITPAALAANTSDYNPTGLATASTLQISASAPVDLTGIAGGVDGRVLLLDNVGANLITLKDANAGSTAANRFAFGADYSLAAGQQVALRYRGSASRWVFLTKPATATTAAVRYVTTAANLPLDSTYRAGIVEGTAACTITLPTLPDDSDNRGWSVTIRNVSTTDSDDLLIAPPSGQAIDAAANNANKKLWPGTEVTLVWIGGNKWVSRRQGGWLPADRAIATAGTELNLDVSLMMIPANARELYVICDQVQISGGTVGDWGVRVSVDGGVTFDTANNYMYCGAIQNTAGGSAVYGSAGTSLIIFNYNLMTNSALTGACKGMAQCFIERPRMTTRPAWNVKAVYPTGVAAIERTDFSGNYKSAAPHSLDAIRMTCATAARPFTVGSTIEAYWR